MDARKLQKKLGIAPGATSKALIDLAERVSPSAPRDAFAPLWLTLLWLEKGVELGEAVVGEERGVRIACAWGRSTVSG